jgi:dihydropteroate synthase
MKEEILIKKLNIDIEKELNDINFSKEYIQQTKEKYENISLKIKNLKSYEANILKQTCLSIGFDASINRNAVTCKSEFSDALISGNKRQFKKLCGSLLKQPFRLKELSKKIQNIIEGEKTFKISNQIFDYSKTYVMGILNVTPDSFSDGGKNFNHETAIENAMEMIKNNVDIIDIGGESTRPNATPVSSEEECRRIIPVIQGIKKNNPDIIISVDTIHPQTIIKAINAGADILNNVDRIQIFQSVFPFLKEKKTPIILTHSCGVPPLPTDKDYDGDIVEHIYSFFQEEKRYLEEQGLLDNLLICDVGIGFGKSINNQFELIKRAEEFSTLNMPILYGISRKSFISKTFGEENRDEITKIYSQYLITKKVNIIRVHDVKGHTDLIKYMNKIS